MSRADPPLNCSGESLTQWVRAQIAARRDDFTTAEAAYTAALAHNSEHLAVQQLELARLLHKHRPGDPRIRSLAAARRTGAPPAEGPRAGRRGRPAGPLSYLPSCLAHESRSPIVRLNDPQRGRRVGVDAEVGEALELHPGPRRGVGHARLDVGARAAPRAPSG
jgi:hypothetical protein